MYLDEPSKKNVKPLEDNSLEDEEVDTLDPIVEWPPDFPGVPRRADDRELMDIEERLNQYPGDIDWI